jgi:glutamate/tyrosine decarboxylase-like PLP-dependent enzyme
MNTALEAAQVAARSWIDGLATRSVAATHGLADLRAAFAAPLPQAGSDPAAVIAHLVRHAEPGLLGSAGGRFFAWVIGGGVEAALGADWLVSTWDQNAAIFACSPAAAVIEEVAGEWVKELLDLPRDSAFAFTTGCQMAHATALAAARSAVLRRAGWDVERDGAFGAPAVAILASDQMHGSVPRACRLLGFGDRALKRLATDADGRIRADALDQALPAHAGPAIVVLNAADLNIAAFDDFQSLIPIARRHGAWVHIDGAFGLIARASRAKRHLLAGVDLADSWATDGHKWLNVPFDCGVAIVRNREALHSAMTLTADYITAAKDARDQIDWNPEWSRRARGLPVYAALLQLGAAGIEDLVDRCCAHCLAIVDGIGALAGARIVWRPTLNQGLVRFKRDGATAAQNDQFTDAVIGAINATGEAFFSGTTWRGARAMRVSVVNWRTTSDDVARAIAAAARVLKELPA